LAVPGLVREVRYRPAYYKQMTLMRSTMSPKEIAITARIVETSGPGRFDGLSSLSDERAALVLDTAVLYHRYRAHESDGVDREAAERIDHEILQRRAAIDARTPETNVPTPVRPDGVH